MSSLTQGVYLAIRPAFLPPNGTEMHWSRPAPCRLDQADSPRTEPHHWSIGSREGRVVVQGQSLEEQYVYVLEGG